MEKEHTRQLDCDQLSIKSAVRNKKQTCINKNILIKAVGSAALIDVFTPKFNGGRVNVHTMK